MKTKYLLTRGLITVLIIGLVLMSGCISGKEEDQSSKIEKRQTTTTIQSTTIKTIATTTTTTQGIAQRVSPKSPSQVTTDYFNELTRYNSNYQKMYDMLSDEAKSIGVDQFSDMQGQIKNSYSQQWVSFKFLGVENETRGANSAKVAIKYKLTVQGYPLTKYSLIALVKENGIWKLNESYTLQI